MVELDPQQFSVDHGKLRRNRLKGIALMCAACLLFTGIDTSAKYLNHYMDTLQVVWARYLGAFLVGVLLVNPFLTPSLLRTARPWLQLGRSVLLLLSTVLNIFALHAVVLTLSVAWQAFSQGAPHLYVTAGIALVFKAIVIPVALHRIIQRLGIHREIETVVGVGPTMLAGMGLVALSLVVILPVTPTGDPLAREDLAFALSVVLLGLLVMVTRRNAVSQVVGFMSLENGLVLAATGAKGMPLVVEISVAFSILIAFIVIGVFLFRIRERFDTVDVSALDGYRGERE